PRAILRGRLKSSVSSTGNGRLGELIGCRYWGRGLFSGLAGGWGLFRVERGCSIDCIIDFGFIWVAGVAIMRAAKGLKVSVANLEEKWDSLGSSGNSSAIRFSNLAICDSSP